MKNYLTKKLPIILLLSSFWVICACGNKSKETAEKTDEVTKITETITYPTDWKALGLNGKVKQMKMITPDEIQITDFNEKGLITEIRYMHGDHCYHKQKTTFDEKGNKISCDITTQRKPNGEITTAQQTFKLKGDTLTTIMHYSNKTRDINITIFDENWNIIEEITKSHHRALDSHFIYKLNEYGDPIESIDGSGKTIMSYSYNDKKQKTELKRSIISEGTQIQDRNVYFYNEKGLVKIVGYYTDGDIEKESTQEIFEPDSYGNTLIRYGYKIEYLYY